MVSGPPFKYASPSNDPAIGIMAFELGINWESVSKITSHLPPYLVPVGLTGSQDEPTVLQELQHSKFPLMIMTALSFGNHVMAL
jgi:hypothetical protein